MRGETNVICSPTTCAFPIFFVSPISDPESIRLTETPATGGNMLPSPVRTYNFELSNLSSTSVDTMPRSRGRSLFTSESSGCHV